MCSPHSCSFYTEVGSFLENHPSGIKLQGLHISGLLYVDDLILIGKTPDDALLKQVQKLLEGIGMSINKSNILYCKDAQLKLGTSLFSSDDEMLGMVTKAGHQSTNT